MNSSKTILIAAFTAFCSIFYSCSDAVAPAACLKITNAEGTEISTSSKLSDVYFVNCGDKFDLNAVYAGVKVPKEGRKPSDVANISSTGLNIPTSGKLRYNYFENTTATGVFEVTLKVTKISEYGKKSQRAEKTVSINITD